MLIISLSILIGIGALAFLGLFVYYSWQFKYGDPGTLARLSREFSSSEFTRASGSPAARSQVDIPIAQFVRSHNPVAGNPSADITILAFIDFECPFCQAGFPVFQEVMQRYGSAVRVVFKHMPLAGIHPNAIDAGLAASCAQEQGKFWEYYTLLFERKILNEDAYRTYATELGLHVQRFATCLANQTYLDNIEQDLLDAAQLEVRGTPTYFINQFVIEGVVPRSTWDTILLEQLQ